MAFENNMVVAFAYELKDAATREVIDSSASGYPLEFITGKSHIIPGLESEIVKMNIGDSAVVVVAPEEAYGIYNEEAVKTYPAEQFAGIELSVGLPLYGQAEDGSTVQVVVKGFNEEEVLVDYNHPLAGKSLEFAITIESARDTTAEEAMTGKLQCADHGGKDDCGTSSCGCH
ncbi:MAG TPA: peptidylprolyl isomerase [Campylobacterales bacterium]|nr:peptidylprolyl isomerase [Campylobacterales bacterium]